MVFSDDTDKYGIVQDIDFWITGRGDVASDCPIEDKTRNVNRWYDKVVSLILQADNRWEWDDANQTDLPIATTTLVDSQQDYGISGFEFLKISRVEVQDNNGNYHQLTPISIEDKRGTAMSEFQKTAGMPKYYDLLGNSVFLYPKPSSSDVTLSEGLKVYYQRNVDYFIKTDTTKKPGFAEIFHRILSLGGAYDYCIANALTSKIAILEKEITKLEQGILLFYTNRDMDDRPKIRLKKTNYGQEPSGNASVQWS